MNYYLEIVAVEFPTTRRRHEYRALTDNGETKFFVLDIISVLNAHGVGKMVLLTNNEEDAAAYKSLLEAQRKAAVVKEAMLQQNNLKVKVVVREITYYNEVDSREETYMYPDEELGNETE
jgi:hypothetical protein